MSPVVASIEHCQFYVLEVNAFVIGIYLRWHQLFTLFFINNNIPFSRGISGQRNFFYDINPIVFYEQN